MNIIEVKANYFDNCSECDEVIDHDAMYEVKVGFDTLRLCIGCTKKLNDKLSRALNVDGYLE